MSNFINKFKEKSLLQRFFFIIGLVFLILYFTLGLLFIVKKDLPFTIPYTNRLAFGVILIVYSIIRFFRIIK
ncbi:hypothetical protein QW060_04200 [Myroides ceti]|uniref:Uncharacterized protein n=1 Tax=Paenimyroides ceti TaxID=395087 RepID=A0ABT8CP92_9FLAO|nr:hypothetical protein [Paenimyroides ceti]MDN3706324.1 hypothetical protein [Paenimyroides ceti]